MYVYIFIIYIFYYYFFLVFFLFTVAQWVACSLTPPVPSLLILPPRCVCGVCMSSLHHLGFLQIVWFPPAIQIY